jgi:hypothetical protein
MTKQVYRSAQGQAIDLGTIKLKNEHVRAVGNMNVNARGDILDSNNQVIEPRNRQIQRQNAQLTNVSSTVVHTSSAAVKRARRAMTGTTPVDDTAPADTPTESVDAAPVNSAPTPLVNDPSTAVIANTTNTDPATVQDPMTPSTGGGLAAAIARSKTIKQEKEKTFRQMQQSPSGVRKI